HFGIGKDHELPPELENTFLKHVMAFEEQFETAKSVKIFTKIGSPTCFRPAHEIPDTEIDVAWNELRSHLNDHGVDLDVCSPNISNRELYRFTLQELFEHETDDLDMPGWTTNFIY